MIDEIPLDLDYDILLQTFHDLKIKDLLEKNKKQISVQHRGVPVDRQLTDGCQSLIYDWEKYDQKIHSEVPKREVILTEDVFNITCDFFKNTYIEYVIDLIKKDYNIYRGRFMLMPVKSSLTYHVDSTKRLHVPIITNPDCFMIISDVLHRLEFRKTYIADTTLKHTAVNASSKDRIHLIFCLGDK